MGGRGTYASGNNVSYQYETIGIWKGVKVLKGIGNIHNLPAEAQSSDKYILLDKDGNFRVLRVYDKDHYLVLEIAYHREPNISNAPQIMHFHRYDRNFNRTPAERLTKEMYDKYKKYFKGLNNAKW